MMWLTSLLMMVFYAPVSVPLRDPGINKGRHQLAQQTQASLELTTSVAGHRYCRATNPEEYNTLILDLRFRYKNISQQHIILYKGSNAVGGQMVSATVQDAARGRYLFDGSSQMGFTNLRKIAAVPKPDKNFVVLSPGATFRTVASTFLLLRRRADDGNPVALGSGDYVLQVNVLTFPYPVDLGSELRQRWTTIGELWLSGVTSKPMTFKVEKDPKFVDCYPK